jgi:DNA polymerase-4
MMNASPHRKIIHVDMDAFYASVEQRDNPDLRGKPVAVGGSRERGVVAAASYEARLFGVRSAMPSVTAKRQCPDLIFVKPRFEAYKAVSQQIREIFAEHTPVIEPLSLDEAYLDVTENLQGIPLARDVALAIRAKIKEVTGLNASAGISYNKFLAKLASDHRKPNGQYVITPEMGPAFVETLPVGKFHGIGPATSAKMNSLGLYTGLDMRNQTLQFMQANFGKAGAYYYWISRGVDDREVRANRIRKSVGAENTFFSDLTEFDALFTELQPLIDTVGRHCEDKGSRGRTVTLKVKFNDFETITRSRPVPFAVSSRSHLERVSIALLQNEMPLPRPVRLLGVSLSSLQDDEQDEPQFGLPIWEARHDQHFKSRQHAIPGHRRRSVRPQVRAERARTRQQPIRSETLSERERHTACPAMPGALGVPERSRANHESRDAADRHDELGRVHGCRRGLGQTAGRGQLSLRTEGIRLGDGSKAGWSRLITRPRHVGGRRTYFRLRPLNELLSQQTLGSEVTILDVRAKNIGSTHVAFGFLIGFVSVDFGLTTVSSCFLIWLETVRDQPVPTLPI